MKRTKEPDRIIELMFYHGVDVDVASEIEWLLSAGVVVSLGTDGGYSGAYECVIGGHRAKSNAYLGLAIAVALQKYRDQQGGAE